MGRGILFGHQRVCAKDQIELCMLREALLNLLDNALIHGGKTLQNVRLTIARKGQDASITVEDDGSGIPAEKLLQARSRFGQAGGSGGSGLGLPIAEKVAQNHGGHLVIGSPTKGVAIEIVLPLLEQPERSH